MQPGTYPQPPILPNPQPPVAPELQEPEPLWRRLNWRLILGVLLPLFVLAGVFGFVLNHNRHKTETSAAPTTQQSQTQQDQTDDKQQPVAATPVDTPAGMRYASVEAAAQLDKAQTLDDVHEVLQTFLDQYSLKLQMATVKPSSYAKQHDTFSTLEAGDLTALRQYAKIFIDEWAKYPPDWVQHSKLDSIVLVKQLVVDGTARAAAPDPTGNALYYDVGYGTGVYAREVIHHEYDHQMEYVHFKNYSRPDTAWTALNPKDFKYNPNGGIAAYREQNFVNTPHPSAGFVDRYATYGLEEDKAEVFAYLMTSDYYHELKQWTSSDEQLANKVQLYKEFIKSISPEMSGDYFDKINP